MKELFEVDEKCPSGRDKKGDKILEVLIRKEGGEDSPLGYSLHRRGTRLATEPTDIVVLDLSEDAVRSVEEVVAKAAVGKGRGDVRERILHALAGVEFLRTVREEIQR
jgi:hypothetical protein